MQYVKKQKLAQWKLIALKWITFKLLWQIRRKLKNHNISFVYRKVLSL
uniref:Uncharacterized protein n=1 Tax=Sphingobacterium sp. (strain 21) TaxID=743722 RepID=F4C2P6_SPHS2